MTRYTRHRLSAYQIATLGRLDQGQRVYVGRTWDSLLRKGLIRSVGYVRWGGLARTTLTPAGAQALKDAQEAMQ